MARKIVLGLIGLLLAAGLVIQLFGTGRYLQDKYREKVLASRRLDAVVRSADGSFGGDFAAYVAFLRSSIPEDSTVVLPPGQAPYYLNDKYLMQYFLFPRNVVTCPSDCTDQIADPVTFIIAAGDFPVAAQVPSSKRLVVFAGGLGLYVPGR